MPRSAGRVMHRSAMALKAKGIRAYRLRGPPSAYQEDHLISLEV